MLKTKEAKEICDKCNYMLTRGSPNAILCAFLNDHEHCDRIEDIDILLEKLFEKVEYHAMQ